MLLMCKRVTKSGVGEPPGGDADDGARLGPRLRYALNDAYTRVHMYIHMCHVIKPPNQCITGSRCIRPPIIVGDIWRPGPLTVAGFKHAQSLTSKVCMYM